MTARPCPVCDHEDDETLCDCEFSVAMARYRPLYEAERAAGIFRPQHEIGQDLRNAGRGHLVRDR